MPENIKLNKVSLREQKQKLGMYQRFLPALEARKQLFLLQLAQIRKQILDKKDQLADALKAAESFAPLYWQMEGLLKPFLEIETMQKSTKNFAGLKVPQLDEVVFRQPAYGFFDTPYSFETVRDRTREIILLRTELDFLEQQEALLSEGLRKTSQRINLYEQRLMPDCRDAIRHINVYLQDQRAVAVGVAKAAKRLKRRGVLTSPCLTASLPSRGGKGWGWDPAFKWSGACFSPDEAVIASCTSCLFWFNECRGAGLTIRGTGR